MVLFPAYLVPFSTIVHITTIRVLLANRRRARDEHTSVAASAMTASGWQPSTHPGLGGAVGTVQWWVSRSSSNGPERAEGRAFQAIADGLMADGIPTARGKQRWYPATIKAVVTSDNAAALW